jgi:ubiquinone/menaquinone biosynthesis C-methylase UbiE
MNCGVDNLVERFYNGHPDWVDVTSRFGNLLRKYTKPGFRVLNLGAGEGNAAPINFKGEVQSVIGLDLSPSIHRNSQIDHAVIGRGEHMPFRAQSFDLVLSEWVVEHLFEPEVAV